MLDEKPAHVDMQKAVPDESDREKLLLTAQSFKLALARAARSVQDGSTTQGSLGQLHKLRHLLAVCCAGEDTEDIGAQRSQFSTELVDGVFNEMSKLRASVSCLHCSAFHQQCPVFGVCGFMLFHVCTSGDAAFVLVTCKSWDS